MKRVLILMLMLYAVNGCAYLSAAGGALGQVVGTGALEAVGAKQAARAEWRSEEARVASVRINMMMGEAQRLLMSGQFDEAMAIMDRVKDEHAEQFPDLLGVEYYRSIARLVDERRKARRAAQSPASPAEAEPPLPPKGVDPPG